MCLSVCYSFVGICACTYYICMCAHVCMYVCTVYTCVFVWVCVYVNMCIDLLYSLKLSLVVNSVGTVFVHP